MTIDEAKVMVKMLRARFYGHELSDFDVIDKAIGNCSSGGFTCLLIVLYYQSLKAWPDLAPWLLICCVTALVANFLFFKRQRRLLLQARAHFIRHTPQHFEELPEARSVTDRNEN